VAQRAGDLPDPVAGAPKRAIRIAVELIYDSFLVRRRWAAREWADWLQGLTAPGIARWI